MKGDFADDRETVLRAVQLGLPVAARVGEKNDDGKPLGESSRLRAMDGESLSVCFAAKARASASTVEFADNIADAPGLISKYLAARGASPKAVCAAAFANLDWRAAGMQIAMREPAADDEAGITGAFCAIAETGTIVVTSAAAFESRASLLPPIHIAVIRRAQIVADLEAALDKLFGDSASPPADIALISGPSRTADIEQTLVLGAHGPLAVHIIIAAEDDVTPPS